MKKKSDEGTKVVVRITVKNGKLKSIESTIDILPIVVIKDENNKVLKSVYLWSKINKTLEKYLEK